MIVFAEQDTGRIVRVITAPDNEIDFYPEEDGLVRILTDFALLDQYLEGEQIKSRPAQPGQFYDWDWSAKAWLPNLHGAKSARKIAVDSERVIRINAPLLYDGKRLDADTRARENLKSKLEEIKSREALLQPMPTEMLVWRDADNITHTWATQEAYKAWLEGFTIAMSERGTLLYAAAWQHKANIEALTDIDSILAYDVTTSWPS